MKFFALAAFTAVASAAAAPVAGTPCEKADDPCTDPSGTEMCCGIHTMGKMCTDEKCTDITSTNSVPNVVACNVKALALDVIVTQPNADKSKSIYW